MRIWTYTIETKDFAMPETKVFGSADAMKDRFVQDILKDERDPGAEGEHDPLLFTLAELRAIRDKGAPIGAQFEAAHDIYTEIIRDGLAGFPYYHFHEDGTEVQLGDHPPGAKVRVLCDDNAWRAGVVQKRDVTEALDPAEAETCWYVRITRPSARHHRDWISSDPAMIKAATKDLKPPTT